MFQSLRRMCVAAALAGAVIVAGASNALATFKLAINGSVVATADAAGNLMYNNTNAAYTIGAIASSQNTATNVTMTTFNISFQNNNLSNSATYVITLTEDQGLLGASGTQTGAFYGTGNFSSSSILGLTGVVSNQAIVKGTGGATQTNTIINNPSFVYGPNTTQTGNFWNTYTGTPTFVVQNKLTVTVPRASGFTYSGNMTFGIVVPAPASLALMASAAPVLGFVWMRRRNKKQPVTA